jgi:hypothetical protein
MKLFPIIGAIILFFTFIGAGLSWDGAWHYRTNISLDNTAGPIPLLDFQIPMNISYDARMKPDFSDLGFTWLNTSDGTETELPFWIEQKSDSGWAYIWVRVKEVPANDYATLYLYFNGSSLSKSNISRTFIFGDDFSANSSDSYYSNGTLEWADGYLRITSGYIHPKNQLAANNIIVEARTNYSNNDSAWLFSGVYALAENMTGPDLFYTSTHKAKYGRNDTSKLLCYDAVSNPCIDRVDINFLDPDFYTIGLYATSDRSRRAEFERNITCFRGSWDSRQGYSGYFTDTDSWLDWFLVRKYVGLVPYSINQEEEYSNLTISIDYPDDSVANNTNDIFFGYTPIAADYDIVNCSLYTTINGAWEVTQVNSTPVLNNSLNLFNLTGLLNQTFVWAVGCMDTFHSTHDALYLTANRTLTIAKPSPVQPAASGGGGGMYLAPPAPSIITSRVSYLDFHSSYALNGTRGYFYNATSQTTTITLMITNLLASDRDFVLMDTIPKDMAVDIDNVAISPTPTTVYNLDPEIGWNVTLPAEGTFTAKYIFKKRVSLESFNSMDLPVITEIVKAAPETAAPTPVQTPVSPTPVSPTTTVTTAGGGITGLVVSTFTNPLFAMFLIAIIILVVVFFKMKREKITTFS